MREWLSGAVGIVLVVIGGVRAADAADGWRDHIAFTFSERVRGEFVDWFRPPSGTAPVNAHRYNFFASQLRVGARVTFPHIQFVLEMQDTRILNLPRKASLAPPIGNLRFGVA